MVAQSPQWTVDQVPETEEDGDLIRRYIRPHPHEYGRAYAYLYPDGPSVAAMIRSLLASNGDVAGAANGWNVSEEAVRAAIAFYRRYREFIDARILLEDDQFDIDFRAEFD